MFRKNFIVLALVSILAYVVISCDPPNDASTTGNIEGVTFDEKSAQPLAGVSITTTPITSSKISDASGKYKLEGVEPGDYTINASKSGYNSKSINVNVVAGETASADLMLLEQGPELTVSSETLNFGTTSNSLTFSISNSGVGTLTWTITSNASWVSVNPSNGNTENETDVVTVTVNRSGMSYGTHYETITLASNANSKTINIVMVVPNPNAAQLTVVPIELDFGNTETTMSFNISNTGTGMLTWNITDDKSWISNNPQSGTTESENDEIAVTINRVGQGPGTYTGTITVSSDGGNQTITVKMTIPDEPALSVSPASLDFESAQTTLTFDVNNAGTGDLTWSISDNQDWITVEPISGTNYSTVNVTVSRDGLSAGDFSGLVTVSSNGGTGNVEINMNVPADDPPTAVTLQAPTDVTENSLKLQWTRNFDSDFAAYKVYRSLSPAVTQSSELLTTITSNLENYYNDEELQPETTYYYRIFVMDMEEQHTGSNVVNATTKIKLGTWGLQAELDQPLWDIWMLDDSFGYAVGNSIYIWSGNQWTSEMLPGNTQTLYAVDGISYNNIYVGGDDGLYHYNGTSWKKIENIPKNISDIKIVNSTDIWISQSNSSSFDGGGGCLYHFNGDTVMQKFDFSYVPYSIDFSDENNGILVLYSYEYMLSKIYYWNGSTWAQSSEFKADYYYGGDKLTKSICFPNENFALFASGSKYDTEFNSLIEFRYSSWNILENFPSEYAYSVASLGEKYSWIAWNDMYFFDGTNYTKMALPDGGGFWGIRVKSIYIINESISWAVAHGNIVLKYVR